MSVLLLLPAPELLLGHRIHWLARSPSRMASVARRPSCEPEWQHGGGGDTTDMLALCEACPLADEVGRPQSRMKKMLPMNMIQNVPAAARALFFLAEFECSILAETSTRSGEPSFI